MKPIIRKSVKEDVREREHYLHRPYIRKSVREEVEAKAEKNEKGQFLDANTKKPIEGKYDLGHVRGHEFWRERERAEKEGKTQEEFNDEMNRADYYQIEHYSTNRGHAFEQPREETEQEENTETETDENTVGEENTDTEENSVGEENTDTETDEDSDQEEDSDEDSDSM